MDIERAERIVTLMLRRGQLVKTINLLQSAAEPLLGFYDGSRAGYVHLPDSDKAARVLLLHYQQMLLMLDAELEAEL